MFPDDIKIEFTTEKWSSWSHTNTGTNLDYSNITMDSIIDSLHSVGISVDNKKIKDVEGERVG